MNPSTRVPRPRAMHCVMFCAALALPASLAALPGCGGGSSAPESSSAAAAAGEPRDAEFELTNIDPEPLPEQRAADGWDSGRAAASTWTGCPAPPPPGVTTADSSPAGGNPVYLSDGQYHMLPSGLLSVWQGRNYSVFPPVPPTGPWDAYINYGAVRPVERVSIAFHSLPYAPATIQVHYSNDPCGAGWTLAGTMSSYLNAPNNANNAEFYYSFAPAINAQYIWLDMDGTPAGGFAAIRDIDWEPVANNTLAYARPNWDIDSYYPSNAFDGDWDTVWTGEKNAGAWNLYYRFPAPQFIPMVNAEILNLNYRPTTMNLYVSNDGYNWTLRGEMDPQQYNAMQFVNQTAQYVRIEMLGNPPSTFPYIREVEFEIPGGASSGDSAQAANPPSYAFDNTFSTYWAGKPGQSEWELIYNNGLYSTPVHYGTVDINFHSINHTPGLTTMYCSNDGITWALLGTFSLASSSSLTVNADCRMIRFHMETAGVYPAAGFPLIDDILSTGWKPLGAGAASGSGIAGVTGYGAFHPAMASFSNGNPVVVWCEKYDPNNEQNADIYAKYWDGAQWQSLANSASGGGISNDMHSVYPKIAVNQSDTVFVVWESDASATSQIYIKKFESGIWSDVGTGSSSGGGISNSTYGAEMPAITINASGNPIVAWHNHLPGAEHDIYAAVFNGMNWQPIGSSLSGHGVSGTGGAYKPTITADASGKPIIAWSDWSDPAPYNEIYIKHWTGSAWQPYGNSATGGGISNTYQSSENPRITTDSSGLPMVFWDDYQSGSSNIYGRRWTGSSWAEIGFGSASGLGISGNWGYSGWSSVTTDASDNPVLTWCDDTSGNFEIYIKRFAGTYWAPIDSSNFGGGISNNTGISLKPTIARDASGNPIVAWFDEPTSLIGGIFVKYHTP